MKQIPDYVFNEMLAITKVLAERFPPDSVKYKNAIRKAVLLHKKLNRLAKKQ